MAKNIAHVTRWLLEQTPEIVKRLERKGDIVEVGDSEKLLIKNIKLLVPEGIEVYRVISEFRDLGEAFFTAREGNNATPAYLSLVTQANGALNFMKNAGDLLRYPWYNHEDSSEIFYRLCSIKKDLLIHIYSFTQQDAPHPFLKR